MTESEQEKVKVVIQNRGVSASHPFILHHNEDEIIVCSVASDEGDSIFDYSIVFAHHTIPWNKSDEVIIDAICLTRNHKESEHGWRLAIKRGISRESIEAVFYLIALRYPNIITRLSRSVKLQKRRKQ